MHAGEMPDELTPEDEQLLDKAWEAVRNWSAPTRTETKSDGPVVLNQGNRNRYGR